MERAALLACDVLGGGVTGGFAAGMIAQAANSHGNPDTASNRNLDASSAFMPYNSCKYCTERAIAARP